ncbi:MAG: class I SAM-dependent methyltransferase [Nitrospirae bacterium]|nr:MAG: class I SAM-dependent methyltransferase [Nitrospirota bacterium]
MGLMIGGMKRWLRWNEPDLPPGCLARWLRKYLLWNNDWYGSHAIRYLPIVRLLRRIRSGTALPVLEVGSADRGITPFLGQRVVALDLRFDRENLSRAEGLVLPVRGRIEHLPFPDASFDAVIAVDMFEHLPASVRDRALREMARVARSSVVIAVPCGQRAMDMEKRLDRYHRKRFGLSNRWLVEHWEHGLPEETAFVREIRTAVPQGRLRVIGNAPLRLWYALEALDIAIPRNYVRRLLTGWIVNLGSRWDAKDPYRRIFVLEVTQP